MRIAVDLRGLPDATAIPRGPSRWARRLAALMVEQAGEHEVRILEAGSAPEPADVRVALGPLTAFDPRLPTVAAIYDLSHLVAPRTHGVVERVRRGWRAALTTRRAHGLLAPSHAIARGLADYLRVGEERLTWLPAIGPRWRRARRDDVERVRSRLELKPRYLLFAGTISRRKNLVTLVRAWDRLWPEVGESVDLVVVGAAPRGAGPILGQALSGGVRYLGPVPDADLVALLSGATAWVCPSLAEGCSIGAVEAMAVGAPPVVAAGTALADIVGSAGLVVPPQDVSAWTGALRHVLSDTDERNRMAARGLRAAGDLREEEAGRRAVAAAAAAAARRR